MNKEHTHYIKNFLITELILITTVISISMLAVVLLESPRQDIGAVMVVVIIIAAFAFIIAIARKLDELLIMNKINILRNKLIIR